MRSCADLLQFTAMKRLILIISIALLLSGCVHEKAISWIGDLFKGEPEVGEAQTLPEKDIVLKTGSEEIRLTVEVADDDAERERGLMYRTKLSEGRGMWFAFEDEAPRAFWMKNTVISLDAVFFTSKGEVIHSIENMQPCRKTDCPSYFSEQPSMFVLELPGGYVKKHGIKVGDTIIQE